jgi:hypothetical protein
MAFQVFISHRFAESGHEAEALKRALEVRGISTFLSTGRTGGDIANEVAKALINCQLAIIMGTRTYGKKASAGCSTFKELRFIVDEPKPFFLIKMCDRFGEPETRFDLNSSISSFPWQSGRSMPDHLVAKILKQLGSVIDGISSSRPHLPTDGKFLNETGKKVDKNRDLDKENFPNGIKHEKAGNVVERDCRNDIRCGKRKFVYANGDFYEGQWKECVWHGKGKMVYAVGGCYEGDWLNGNTEQEKKNILMVGHTTATGKITNLTVTANLLFLMVMCMKETIKAIKFTDMGNLHYLMVSWERQTIIPLRCNI